MELVAELTLIVVLASNASRIDVCGVFRDHNQTYMAKEA